MSKIPAKSFTDLIFWQKSRQLVLYIYSITNHFPKTEIYGLTSQIRRAAGSVPANIADGFKKRTRPDKIRSLNIAHGSLEECRYYLILADELGYGVTNNLLDIAEEVGKLLQSYSKAIEQNNG